MKPLVGVPRLGPRVADAEAGAGLIEGGFEPIAAIGQHALERPARLAEQRNEHVAEEAPSHAVICHILPTPVRLPI
jgi:hypothetical protein